MKKEWAAEWNASKQPRKQKKYRYNAPLHIKRRFFHVHLAKELQKKYNKRQLSIRKDDKVRIMVGDFKGKEGKVTKVLLKKGKVYVEGIECIKKDGSKAFIPLKPSNLLLISLGKEDRRQKKIRRKNEKTS